MLLMLLDYIFGKTTNELSSYTDEIKIQYS